MYINSVSSPNCTLEKISEVVSDNSSVSDLLSDLRTLRYLCSAPPCLDRAVWHSIAQSAGSRCWDNTSHFHYNTSQEQRGVVLFVELPEMVSNGKIIPRHDARIHHIAFLRLLVTLTHSLEDHHTISKDRWFTTIAQHPSARYKTLKKQALVYVRYHEAWTRENGTINQQRCITCVVIWPAAVLLHIFTCTMAAITYSCWLKMKVLSQSAHSICPYSLKYTIQQVPGMVFVPGGLGKQQQIPLFLLVFKSVSAPASFISTSNPIFRQIYDVWWTHIRV